MITETKFYGSVVYYSSAGTRQLYWNSPRVIIISNASDSVVILPPTNLNHYYGHQKDGGPSFYIINKGTGSVAIKQDTELIDVLTQNKVGLVLFKNSGAKVYVVRKLTLNTPRIATNGTREETAAAPPEPTTYNPYCFEGDLCERITFVGSPASIPMFQNPCDAKNSWREPIRAADFRMPSVIPVTITKDTFSIDSLHPEAGSITQETLDALFNDGRPWEATYEGRADGPSYHWHNLRWAYDNSGSPYGAWDIPTDGSNQFIRHVWKATKDYTVNNVTYTMELRVVAEHTVNPQPILVATPTISYTATSIGQFVIGPNSGRLTDNNGNLLLRGFAANQIITVSGFTGGGTNGTFRILSVPSGGEMFVEGAFGEEVTFHIDGAGESVNISTVTAGGTNSPSVGGFGAWGSLIHIYVFTDQIRNGESDPITYTPEGSASPIAFTRDNPAHTGLASSQSEALKFCHPQLILCAHVPTTMEMPCEYSYIPIDKRNRKPCYQLPNALPWIPFPLCCGTPSTLNGLLYNSVFGSLGSGANWAATTIGGDFPSSQPLEWVTIENGTEEGITPLTPLESLAGWNPLTGQFNIAFGSAMAIALCDSGQLAVDVCDGHPDEPFEGIGGTHYCFRTQESGNYCCTQIQDTNHKTTAATIIATELCQRVTTLYDGTCMLISQVCAVTSHYRSTRRPLVDDYTYNMDGDQSLRELYYHEFALRFDAVWYNWPVTFPADPSTVADWHSDIGTISIIGTAATGATLSGGRAALIYRPSLASHSDVTISANVVLAASTPAPGTVYEAGVCVRAKVTTGQLTAYALLAGTNGSIRLVKIVNDVVTLLGGLTAGTPTLSASLSLRCIGSRLIATVGTSFSLTLDDCDIDGDQTNHPGLLILDADSTTISWANIRVTDRSLDSSNWAEADVTIGPDAISANIDPPISAGYGKCDNVQNAGCGSTSCNCSTWTETLNSGLSASFTTSLYNSWAGGQGAHPHCWEGPQGAYCEPGTSRCGPCPPPFIDLEVKLVKCGEPTLVSTASICNGFKHWVWSQEVCA